MISIIGMIANRGHGSEPWAEEEAFAAVTILFWADEKNSCAPNTWTLKLRSSVIVSDKSKFKLHWFCSYCLYFGITFLLISRILILYSENTIAHYNLSKQNEYNTFCLNNIKKFHWNYAI